MAESPSSGSSQRAAAMAALSASSDEIQVNARHVSSEQKAAEGEKALQSARQQAMAKLNRKGSTGVVSKSQGSSQHGQALAGLQGKLADKVGTGAKVVPNWKMTAAQKNAAAARAEIKGSGNHSLPLPQEVKAQPGMGVSDLSLKACLHFLFADNHGDHQTYSLASERVEVQRKTHVLHFFLVKDEHPFILGKW